MNAFPSMFGALRLPRSILFGRGQRTALGSVNFADYFSGMFKTPFFGAIIAILGCHFGLITRGGTEGVGQATTRTVVAISISILVADFFLTKVSIFIFPGK